MYFHLIGIKEKNGEKYDLDILLQGGDEDFIRKFLGFWGVVIVSINEFKEDPSSFGNILVNITYDNTPIEILIQGEDLAERMYFVCFLGLQPQSVNFVSEPIAQDEMQNMLNATFKRIDEENEKIKQQKELEELQEQKKYEEAGIKDGLRIINSNIDHIEQVIKAGEGILTGSEIKNLEDSLNEMKKIRLGTNFNKMAALVLDAHIFIKKAEEEIFEAYSSGKFMIDKNSTVSNIDLLKEIFTANRISEKSTFQPSGLTTTESVANMMGPNAILIKLLGQDISFNYEKTSLEDFIDILISFLELIVLISIIVVSVLWLAGLLLGIDKFSLYLLPALGWLGLLIYILNNLHLKGIILKLVAFVVIALIYWQGLNLLLNTFAL